ncbi:unnamed protein product, partial [Closterium sp. Naga37s-1]
MAPGSAPAATRGVVVTPQGGSHDDGAPMPTLSQSRVAARDEEAATLPSQCDAEEEDLVLSQREHEEKGPLPVATSDQPDEEENQLNVATTSRSTRHSMTSSTTTTIGSTLFRTTSTNGSTSSIGSFDDDGMMAEEDAKPCSGALEAASGASGATGASGASGDTNAKGVGVATHENGDGSNKKPGLLAACRRIADGILPAFLRKVRRGSYWDLFVTFFFLGWTSFGGAAAHIAMYHKQFVELRGWMTEDMFAELLALTQTVPGPSSTQMSLAIGIMQKGITGGFLSWILFQLPGALIMSVAGFGVAKFLVDPPAWLSAISAGATAVAVALIADAAVMLGSKMCRNRVTRMLCVTSAAITFYYTTQWIFPTVILLVDLPHRHPAWRRGHLFHAAQQAHPSAAQQAHPYAAQQAHPYAAQQAHPSAAQQHSEAGRVAVGRRDAAVCVDRHLVFAIVYNNAITKSGSQWMHLFEGFYMTGSVTYGGGPVMLPLLESIVIEHETVCPPGGGKCFEVDANTTMITTQQFLAGLALSQAIPGPLFNFSAYLGSVIGGIRGLATCWIAIFSPGVLIIIGILPFWGQFRKWKLSVSSGHLRSLWVSRLSKSVPSPWRRSASACLDMLALASS